MDHCFTCGERKSLVKHRKVSKYFETDCSYRLHKHISSIIDEKTTPKGTSERLLPYEPNV